MAYAEAFEIQRVHLQEVIEARGRGGDPGRDPGRILLVEHDPVITVSRRAGAGEHILAPTARLEELGVAVEPTDRGGDITYHGPGQLVVYPILDLNALNLRLVPYMRLLESVVIKTLGRFGIRGERDESATGVWTPVDAGTAKIAAMGVRVRRWVTMHGLALNVDPDMSHFELIVPCGLHGRTVTSMRRILGDDCPTLDEVSGQMREVFSSLLSDLGAGERAPV
jgi:lipoate-protein ligase B